MSQPVSEYEISTCPVCGAQLDERDMYGEGWCSTHGTVKPLTVAVRPLAPTTAPAWRIKNTILQKVWVMTDPGFTGAEILETANQPQADEDGA